MTARDEDFRTPYLMAMRLGGISVEEADELLDAHDKLRRTQVLQEVTARLGAGQFWFDPRDRASAMATVLSMADATTPTSKEPQR